MQPFMKTHTEVRLLLDDVWNKKFRKIDWLQYEYDMKLIANSWLTADEKVAAIKELLDAHTRRGHFLTSEYLQKRDTESLATYMSRDEKQR